MEGLCLLDWHQEFTDAPREMAEERSARAEKAFRQLREQEESWPSEFFRIAEDFSLHQGFSPRFEEDTMQRMKVKKSELRKQKQALREGRATSGGAVSLFDA